MHNKRIFFLTGGGSLGGHTRTAKIQAYEMHRRGYDVHIITAGSDDIYSDIDIPLKKIRSDYIDSYHSNIFSIIDFNRYAKEVQPDIIHAFDLSGLFVAYWYARQNKVRIVLTICGGQVGEKIPYPNMKPVVIFSAEQKKGFIKRGCIEADNLIVSPGRVDLDFETLSEDETKQYKYDIGINSEANIVLMICRLGSSKKHSLQFFLDIAATNDIENNIHYLVVGEYRNQDIYKELKQKADHINKLFNKNVITITDKGCENARKLWPLAKVAVGVGRTAYESMARGIPTLVIGEYGFAGVACGDRCDILAEFNFSGRNAQSDRPQERSPRAAAIELKKLLTDSLYYEAVSKNGKRWVGQNMDVRSSGEIYEHLYNKDASYYKYPKTLDVLKLGCYLTARKYWLRVTKKYG